MNKKRTQNEDKDSKPVTGRQREEPESQPANLIELRHGLFVNMDHVVSVRVLPEEDGRTYAVMQLSSGEKLSLTRGEFIAVCGVEPRPPVKMPPTYVGKKT